MRKENIVSVQPGILQGVALMTAGAVIGLVVTLVGLLICAFLTAAGSIPETMMTPVTVLVCAVGSGVSGFLGAKSIGKQALLTGIVTGIVYFLILVILGALFLKGLLPEEGILAIFLASIVGATLGSIAQAALKR